MGKLIEYKCPSCGGIMEFDSASGKMKCPYCDTVMSLEEYREQFGTDEEEDTASSDEKWNEQANEQWSGGEGLKSYVCHSCGGEIVADAATGASACPFCGNPVVMQEQFSGMLRPDYLIPFKLDKKAARQAYLKHLEGKPFLPAVFRDENHIDEIRGVYVPFWLYDGTMTGEVLMTGTTSSSHVEGDYQVTRVRHYRLERSGKMDFDKVPVNASTGMNPDLMESIEPYETEGLTDYAPEYLAGYYAERFQLDEDSCEERAAQRIHGTVLASFKATARSFSDIRVEQENLKLSRSEHTYALYPVWLLNTTWNGEHYTFAMNGQTGRLVGDLPSDNGAFTKYILIRGAIASVVLILLTILGSFFL